MDAKERMNVSREYILALFASAVMFLASGFLFVIGVRSLRDMFKPVDFYAE